jgi:NitT/TauT family transport system permease protein
MPDHRRGRSQAMVKNAAIHLSTFIVAAIIWEMVAKSGRYPPALFPDLTTVGKTFMSLLGSGILVWATLGTLYRLLLGYALGAIVGVAVGMVMGRYRRVEDFLLPAVSIGYPIPALAYAPLFVLWFGLGDTPSILLVMLAAALQITINTWKGVVAVKPIWLRSAEAMGADEPMIFHRVVLPASLPYTMTGLRLGLGAAWRVLVGVEMITAVTNGLGSLIFGAKQFLQTDVMLSGVIAIGVIGYLLERYLFSALERVTLYRWGMIR